MDEFYVGYLPTPPGLGRFLRALVLALVIAACGVAALVAALQGDPGAATWALERVADLEGVLLSRPYPLLRVQRPTEGGSSWTTVLLVSEGKIGALERVRGLDGAVVRARGHLLERDGRRMLELLSQDDALTAVAGDPAREGLAPPDGASGNSVTLRGEIVDPKCFSGAMKPGEGKPHKACAALCLRGGIPPMFVTTEGGGGRARYHLLVNRRGEGLVGSELRALIGWVGDAVELEGERVRWGDLDLLKVDPREVRRP